MTATVLAGRVQQRMVPTGCAIVGAGAAGLIALRMFRNTH